MPTSTLTTETVNVATDVGTALLRIDVPGRSVNVLNRQLLADLNAAFDHVTARTDVQMLVVSSAKTSGFLAGADLQEFQRIGSASEASALSELGQRLFDKLETLAVPSVAVLSGACLGGGL